MDTDRSQALGKSRGQLQAGLALRLNLPLGIEICPWPCPCLSSNIHSTLLFRINFPLSPGLNL